MKTWASKGGFGGSDFRHEDIGEVPPLTETEMHAARLHVAAVARDPQDALELMEALGIAPERTCDVAQ